MSKQVGIQIDDDTKRKVAQIAKWYGLPEKRHLTPVIVKAVNFLYFFEITKRRTDINVVSRIFHAMLNSEEVDDDRQDDQK